MDAALTTQVRDSQREARRRFVRNGWMGVRTPGRSFGTLAWAERVLSGALASETLNARASSVTHRVAVDAGEVYVKHTRESLWRGIFRLERPQAWRVARLERRMAEAGLSVPRVWLAATRWGLGGVEHVVVMAGVEGASLFDLRRRCGRGESYGRAIDAVAVAAARLHDRGFAHGDLVPGNVLLGEGASLGVTFIDNDRTRRVYGPWRWRARVRNAAQMCHRLRLLGRWADARRFLRAYGAASGWPADRLRLVRRGAVRRARREFGLSKALGLRREMDGGPVYTGL